MRPVRTVELASAALRPPCQSAILESFVSKSSGADQSHDSASSSALTLASARLTVLGHFGGLQAHLIDRVDDDAADQCPQSVLVVGRHHVPRRPRGRGGAQRFLVRALVLRPQCWRSARSATENFQFSPEPPNG